MNKMAMPRRSTGEDARDADALGDALQQVATRMQEALRQQQHAAQEVLQGRDEAVRVLERRMEERMQRLEETMAQEALQQRDEAVRALERRMEERVQRLEEAMAQEALQQRDEAVRALERRMEERVQRLEEAMAQEALQQRDETVRALERRMEERVQNLEERVTTVEVILPLVELQRTDGGGASVEELEARMKNLEASVQKALVTVFPRVEALVTQLEETSPPGAVGASTSATRATGAAAASARAAAVGHTGAATDEEEEERQKQRVQLRIQEVRKKMQKAHALPLATGEKLCSALRQGNIASACRFLDSGTSVNYTDKNGSCPLIVAFQSKTRMAETVPMLLERGADVNVVDLQGCSALHFAACYDASGQLVRRLLGAGAGANARDSNGESPLHWAAQWSNSAAVRELLAAGARKELACWGGGWRNMTPFHIARSDALLSLLRP